MQINIEVNDTQFKELMDKSIAELPKEKIQEIVVEGIKEYIKTSDMIKNLLTERSTYSYSVTATPFLCNLINKMTPTDGINDIRDEMLGMLRKNYDQVLREAVATTLVNGICNNSAFQDSVRYIFLTEQATIQSRSNN